MSTTWKGDVVLLREPTSALWLRLGGRLLRAMVCAVAAYLAPWAWLRGIAVALTLLVSLLVVASIVNWVRGRGELLVLRGTGAIERPRSIQEVVLRRPVEQVVGSDVVVESELVVLPGRAGERMRLIAGDTRISRVPLYGDTPEAWAERTNELLVGRDTHLRYVPPFIPPDPSEDEQ